MDLWHNKDIELDTEEKKAIFNFNTFVNGENVLSGTRTFTKDQNGTIEEMYEQVRNMANVPLKQYGDIFGCR